MSEVKLKNNKKIIAISAVLAVLLIGGGLWWWIRAAGMVSTDDARVKGSIVTVSSRVSARVEELLVNEGDQVQAGQVIAKLESKELEAQYLQAKANLAAAEAKLAGLKAGSRPQQILTFCCMPFDNSLPSLFFLSSSSSRANRLSARSFQFSSE